MYFAIFPVALALKFKQTYCRYISTPEIYNITSYVALSVVKQAERNVLHKKERR
jgi:hypothetical protein